jgi:hypothetical protein
MQLGDEEARGGVPELHRADESEQVVPVIGDQLGLDGLGEQRPCVRVTAPPCRTGAQPVELQPADVADPRRELQAGEVEDRERGQGLAGGVGGVLSDGQVGRIAEDLIEDGDGFTPGGRDNFGAVGRVLIGHTGIGGGPLVEEVPRQRPGGEATTALRKTLAVR